MHILGLEVTTAFENRCVDERQALTIAKDIDDAISLASLDRRNGCYQFDAVVVHVIDSRAVEYPHRIYETGVRVPILVLYDPLQFAGVQVREWYRQGVLLCISDASHMDILMSALRSQVAFNRRIDPRQLVAGDLKINTTTREVFVAEEQLLLTEYEYRALEILVRRKNMQVRTEDMFYEICGRGEDVECDDNMVKVYVSKLRKKLRQYPRSFVTIKTVWAVGYKLSEKPHALNS